MGTLAFGLHEDSRVKMHFSNQKIPTDRILLARITDELAFQSWAQTKDAQRNRNRPKSILQAMLGTDKKEEYVTFESMDEFKRLWDSI